MRRITLSLAAAAAVTAMTAGSAIAAPTVLVTSSADSGNGSFRAAVALANAKPAIKQIAFAPGLGTIALTQPVEFDGRQNLTIKGSDAVIDGAGAGGTAFLATGGGNLTIESLTVANAPQQGIEYRVPATAFGVVKVNLSGVSVLNNAGHGVLVDDQVDPEDVENEAGSAASVRVAVSDSEFFANGSGALDRDGLRVDEGGEGWLQASISGSRFDGNGGDGIELDERGTGDAGFRLDCSVIVLNGGFDIATDPDDGMDVDESGDGSILGRVTDSVASENEEQGLDYNENGPGDLRVDLSDVTAEGNKEEGIEFEEDDDVAGGGGIVSRITDVTANGNGANDGDAGLKLREKGLGDLSATLRRITAADNDVSGVQLREDDLGNLSATVRDARTTGNGDRGIDVDENSDGNLTATIRDTTANDNADAGVRADQADPGVGLLQLIRTTLEGNGQPLDAEGVTVVVTP